MGSTTNTGPTFHLNLIRADSQLGVTPGKASKMNSQLFATLIDHNEP